MKKVRFNFSGIVLIIALLSIGIFFSCKKTVNYYQEEMTILEKYIADSSITTEPTSSGLYYIENQAGTGEKARFGYRVFVRYKGYLLDGTIFDQNIDSVNPLDFMLGYGQVISGWDEGISYMHEGGKAKLIIPSSLGYGSVGSEKIPAYSTLIFDVELEKVQDFK